MACRGHLLGFLGNKQPFPHWTHFIRKKARPKINKTPLSEMIFRNITKDFWRESSGNLKGKSWVPEIYQHIPPIHGLYNGCIGQYGGISGYPKFPLENRSFARSQTKWKYFRGTVAPAPAPQWMGCATTNTRNCQSRLTFCNARTSRSIIPSSARWAPTSYKWCYKPYKWPYSWVIVVITPVSGQKNWWRGPPYTIVNGPPKSVGYMDRYKSQTSQPILQLGWWWCKVYWGENISCISSETPSSTHWG